MNQDQMIAAIDVGSGMSKLTDGSQRVMFQSMIAPFSEAENRFGATPLLFDSESSRLVRAGRYVFGRDADVLVQPAARANTLSADWSGSDAWGALMLVALAHLKPDGYRGVVHLATGIPQALYNERREDLARRMEGVHVFTFRGKAYEVDIRPFVLPQAAAAVLAADDLGDVVGGRGVIDPGTFTTGMAVIFRASPEESFNVQYWRSGGVEVGVSKVVSIVSEEVSRRFGGKMSESLLHAALKTRKLSVRGESHDIGAIVDRAISSVSGQIVEEVSKLWPNGGMDLNSISSVGGGAALFGDAIQQAFPQARIEDDAQWAVVNGLYRYAAENVRAD